ncbi:MAG: hypothetical protein WD690_10420 [Vicinamibacterales bacterium]
MKKMVVVLCFVAAFSAVPSAAWAGCFEDLAACFQNAATRDTWFKRWLAGMDCELEFIDCGREKLIGR